MAYPSHVPTDETRAQVAALASFGIGQEDIGAFIGISHVTLRKHYDDELKLSAIKANAQVAKYLFSLASGQAMRDEENPASHADCKTAAMFWMKTRARWRETAQIDHTSSDGSMTPQVITLNMTPQEAAEAYAAALNPEGE